MNSQSRRSWFCCRSQFANHRNCGRAFARSWGYVSLFWVVWMVGGFFHPIAVSAAAPPASTFTLDATSFASGKENGSAVFTLKLTGDAAAQDGALKLEDRMARDRPEVTLTFQEGTPNIGDKSRTWFVRTTIVGLPVNSSLPRFLVATYGGHTQTLQYTLSNKPNATFTWKVVPVTAVQRWNASDPLRLAISVGSVPATAVRLLPSDFVDAEGLKVLKRTFKLCLEGQASSAAACDSAVTLPANGTYNLSIRPIESDTIDPGEYKGNFTLISAEKPDGENFPSTLHVSEAKWQWIGAGLILLGIFLAWLVNVVLQRRNEENAALRPAALLAEQMTDLQSERRRIAGLTSLKLDNTEANLNDLLSKLSRSSLRAKGYIRNSFEFYVLGGTAQSTTYQQYLAELEKQVALLSLLIEVGFRQAAASRTPNPSADESRIIREAIREMDRWLLQGQSWPTKEDLSTNIKVRLANMNASLSAATGMQFDASAAAFSVGYSSERIAFETTVINFAGWVFFAVISFVTGCYLLVLSDPSFGQWKDLLFCFFWGFGLPTTADKLASISSPGIAKTFGVTLTKGAQ